MHEPENILFICNYFYRGDDFRVAFSQLGELRSIIPSNVHVLALRATATSETLAVVTRRLSLHNPVVLGLPPDRCNTFYRVSPLPALQEVSHKIATDLQMQHTSFPKTLVFCQRYQDCTELYATVRHKMSTNFTEPVGYPDLHQFRLIDMYTRVSINIYERKSNHIIFNTRLKVAYSYCNYSIQYGY